MNSAKRIKINAIQWSAMLDFIEEHPILITQKFENINSRENYNKLWLELANHLNSLGFGMKPVEKWQRSLTDWKQKVKTKAHNLKVDQKKTGGGNSQIPPLNENELRLINLMGWTAISGNNNLELGIVDSSKSVDAIVQSSTNFASVPSTSTNNSSSEIHNINVVGKLHGPNHKRIHKNVFLQSSNLHRENAKFIKLPKNIVLKPVSPNLLTNSSNNVTQISCKSQEIIKRNESRKRKVTSEDDLTRMHKEVMGVLSSINANMNRLANSADLLVSLLAEQRDRQSN